RRTHAELVLIVATRLADLGSVDVGNADLHAIKPESISIHDACPPDGSADVELRGARLLEQSLRLLIVVSKAGIRDWPVECQHHSSKCDRECSQHQRDLLSQLPALLCLQRLAKVERLTGGLIH